MIIKIIISNNCKMIFCILYYILFLCVKFYILLLTFIAIKSRNQINTTTIEAALILSLLLTNYLTHSHEDII